MAPLGVDAVMCEDIAGVVKALVNVSVTIVTLPATLTGAIAKTERALGITADRVGSDAVTVGLKLVDDEVMAA